MLINNLFLKEEDILFNPVTPARPVVSFTLLIRFSAVHIPILTSCCWRRPKTDPGGQYWIGADTLGMIRVILQVQFALNHGVGLQVQQHDPGLGQLEARLVDALQARQSCRDDDSGISTGAHQRHDHRLAVLGILAKGTGADEDHDLSGHGCAASWPSLPLGWQIQWLPEPGRTVR